MAVSGDGHRGPWMIGRALIAAVAIGLLSVRASASGFVYVAVPAAACVSGSTCAPEVLVVDADTAAIVTRLSLPQGTTPAGIALSPNGVHLYVSNAATAAGSAAWLTVIDARHHVIEGTFGLQPGQAGPLAVRGDDSVVFMAVSTRAGLEAFPDQVSAFDTSSHALTTVAPSRVGGGLFGSYFTGLAVDLVTNRLIVAEFLPIPLSGPLVGPGGFLTAYDAGSLAKLADVDVGIGGVMGIGLSRDGRRLHQLFLGRTSPTNFGGYALRDPLSFALVSRIFLNNPRGTPVDVARSNEVLLLNGDLCCASFKGVLTRLGGAAPQPTLALGDVRAITVPPGEKRAYVTVVDSAGASALVAVDLDANAVAASLPLAGASAVIASSPEGAATCRYGLDSAFSSHPIAGGAGSVRLTTDCAWQASSNTSWVRLSAASGTSAATIGLTVDPNPLPLARTGIVTIGGQRVTVTQAGGVSQAPFGAFETPVDGASGITGSVAVTGWAMDDVGVARVRIFRDSVAGEAPGTIFIGDASLVEGARPDVGAVFPSAPFNTRAGWGYLLLTNFLPGSGNSTVRLHAYAEDVEGNTTLLGSKTVTVKNAGATLPFGTLDTPGQGELVSGTIVNFGWALTPQPANIPSDGSTIDVVVDGIVVGHPTYNQPRSDIAGLFPGYQNTSGPVGFFTLDTRALPNGLHTIAWVVRDSLGRGEGIGSRFFTVFNAASSLTIDPSSERPGAPANRVAEGAAAGGPAPGAAGRAGDRDGDDRVASSSGRTRRTDPRGATAAVADRPEGREGEPESLSHKPGIQSASLAAQNVEAVSRVRVGSGPAPASSVQQVHFGERIEIDLSGPASEACRPSYAGSVTRSGAPEWPAGATIDRAGRFQWTPAADQAGTYEVEIIRTLCETIAERRLIHLTILGR